NFQQRLHVHNHHSSDGLDNPQHIYSLKQNLLLPLPLLLQCSLMRLTLNYLVDVLIQLESPRIPLDPLFVNCSFRFVPPNFSIHNILSSLIIPKIFLIYIICLTNYLYFALSPPINFGLLRTKVVWAEPIWFRSKRRGTATACMCIRIN